MNVLVQFVLLACTLGLAVGNGRLVDPPMRSSLWRVGYDSPANYNDHTLNCGGFERQHTENGGKCGVCGDPWDSDRENEAPGKYANGIITRQYTAGSDVTMTIEMLAPRGGFFELRLCPVADSSIAVTQACLDQHPLPILNGEGTRYPVEGEREEHHGTYDLTVRLPADVTCTQCVIQWRYHAGNEWGYEEDGRMCRGCGPQMEQYNCADVAISAGSGAAVPASPPVSSPVLSSGVKIRNDPVASDNANAAADANTNTMDAPSDSETPIPAGTTSSQGGAEITNPTKSPSVTTTAKEANVAVELENGDPDIDPSPTPYVTVNEPSPASAGEATPSRLTQPAPAPTPSVPSTPRLFQTVPTSSPTKKPTVEVSDSATPATSQKPAVDKVVNDPAPTQASRAPETTIAADIVDDSSSSAATETKADTAPASSSTADTSGASVEDSEEEDPETSNIGLGIRSRQILSNRISAAGGQAAVGATVGGAAGGWVGLMNQMFQLQRAQFFLNQIWGNQGNFGVGRNTWGGMGNTWGMGFWPTNTWGGVQGGQWGGNSLNQNNFQQSSVQNGGNSWTTQGGSRNLASHLPRCQAQQRLVCSALRTNDQRTTQYCQQNCPTGGNCPVNLCSCSCLYRQGLQCRYLTTGLALPANHQWCNDRCNSGSCPTQYCECNTVVNW